MLKLVLRSWKKSKQTWWLIFWSFCSYLTKTKRQNNEMNQTYVNQFLVHWSRQKATHLMQWTRYWSTFTLYNESPLMNILLQKGFYHIVCQLENRNEAIILQCSFIGFVQVSYSLKRKILSITTLLLVPYTFFFFNQFRRLNF